MSDVPTVGLADIEEARKVLTGVSIETPMEESRWLSALAGGPVSLKCENLQRTGSFKARGAYVRISRLTPEERARGVVAASAGNHAQGVALAAQLLGIRATVFMPEGAPIPKEKATRGYGADVSFHGRYLEDALVEAHAFAERTGAVLIHPFDHVDIVAGQGTCGLEILEQAPEVRTVLVPLGGGGLLAGIAIAIKAKRPDVRLIGVQAAGAAAFPGSLRHGAPVRLESMSTMADGIAVGRPGEITFAAVRDHVDEILTVSEDALARAVLAVLERAKMVVEPAGAAAVAAVMDQTSAFEGAGRRSALRRQHRSAAARQGDPARHGGRRALPRPAGLHPRPARRPGAAAHRHRQRRWQRPRGRARAHVAGAARRRGRGARPARDPRRAARPAGARPAPRARLPGLRVAQRVDHPVNGTASRIVTSSTLPLGAV